MYTFSHFFKQIQSGTDEFQNDISDIENANSNHAGNFYYINYTKYKSFKNVPQSRGNPPMGA